jgi:hypothetical protein
MDHGIPLRVSSGHVAAGNFLRPRLVGWLILFALILVNSVIGVNSAVGSFETRLLGDAHDGPRCLTSQDKAEGGLFVPSVAAKLTGDG